MKSPLHRLISRCTLLALALGSVCFHPARARADGARPDLVPQTVTVDPGSVASGGGATVTYTVANQGGAGAPPSVTRVRLSTSATQTSSDDLVVADFPTSAIAAGASVVSHSSITLPGGTPAGTYYLWVVVDNTDVVDESNATNDAARSSALMVTASATAPPTIDSLSADQTINDGSTATFTVTPGGTGPFAFQWFYAGIPIHHATASKLVATQDGLYTVKVTNAGGAVTSDPIRLTVNTTAVPQVPPMAGKLLLYGNTFSPSLPTVVLTHGWQPSGSYNYASPQPVAWQQTVAASIQSRLGGSTKVNILQYTWPGAYTHSLSNPFAAFADVEPQGSALATQLRALYGAHTPTKIQLIGHSYGSFVNLFAVGELTWHIDQFSILDSPINFDQAPGAAVYAGDDESVFRLILPPSRVDFVDNYIATQPTQGLVFGARIAGAAPAGGEPVATNHTGITGWYNSTVAPDYTGGDGFEYSVLLGAANGEVPLPGWNPPPVVTSVVDRFADADIATAGNITTVTEAVDGTLENAFKLADPATGSTGDAVGVAAGDSAIQFPLSIPLTANKLSFDFRFAQPGAGDYVTVAFNNLVLYDFLGTSFTGTAYQRAELPIRAFAGASGLITVTLHSASATASELHIGNFQFVSLPVPGIIRQPVDVTVSSGGTATFAVLAAGSELAYQWEFKGTPIAGATGPTYTVNNVTSDNAGGYTVAVGNLGGAVISAPAKLTVLPTEPPTVTSATTASATVGSQFSYQITATNSPTSYSATGLRDGLSINTTTGIISGKPPTAGTVRLTISATNAIGTGSATLTITVAGAPVITSATSAAATVGEPFTYHITANNNPTSFSASGLRDSLTFNADTGVISGTPTTAGSLRVTISASNTAGTGSATLTITVADSTKPVITSATTAAATVGEPFTYHIMATHSPTSFSASGLRDGLTLNTTTGVISGTPPTAGTVKLTINATNSSGTGSATLTIMVAATAKPVITSAATASATVGEPFAYHITATNNPTSYSATDLRDSLTVNTTTGVISGTPTTAGTVKVTIGATNSAGSDSATVTITVAASTKPLITSATTAAATAGEPLPITSWPPTARPVSAPRVCATACRSIRRRA